MDVIELEGRPLSPWRQKRIEARAERLYEYLDYHEGESFTQARLCEYLELGRDGVHLKEAVSTLEDRGWISVDRTRKPHRYTLTKETA